MKIKFYTKALSTVPGLWELTMGIIVIRILLIIFTLVPISFISRLLQSLLPGFYASNFPPLNLSSAVSMIFPLYLGV
jgi:hypothetical protein